MKKMIKVIEWPIYFSLWIIILLGLFGLSLGEYVWVMIKKRKMAQKIIFSNPVQTCKEKLTGRPKITIKQYENSYTSR